MSHRLVLWLALVAVSVASSCGSARDSLPDIAGIYRDAARNEVRNPVVVVHGILGARLADSKDPKRTVWGAFTNEWLDPATPEGAHAVALPIDSSPEDAVATGPLERLDLSLLFQVFSVKIYENIIRTLGAGGYSDQVLADRSAPEYDSDHYTCHSFFYDWRQDNVRSAQAFGEYLEGTRERITSNAQARIRRLRASGTVADQLLANEIQAWLDEGFKFDVVAHSMGGLLARYYLRYGDADLPADGSEPEVTWAGAEQIGRLVMVATPNLGSMDALRQLTSGFQPAPLLPFYDQAVLGTMPSIYQLLPRVRHNLTIDANGDPVAVDFMDVDVWERNQWGIFDPAVDETVRSLAPNAPNARELARQHIAGCLDRARQFHRAMDKRPQRPSPVPIYLFAADSNPTLARTVIEEDGGRLVPTFPHTEATILPGDLTVARYSTLGDEREGNDYRPGLDSSIKWSNVTFLSDDHIGLTMNPHFANNILFIMLEDLDL